MKKILITIGLIFMSFFTFNVSVNADEMMTQQTKVIISKVNEKDEPLIGSKLQILDLNGNVLYEWISDGSDYEIMLPAGKYILHEVEAPEGYILAEDQVFEVEVIIENEIVGDADMNGFPCDHGEDNSSPMYYVEINGISYEVYCINQGLKTPNGNDYDGQIITPDELRNFTLQETNIDGEGFTISGNRINVNTEIISDYDVSDQTLTNEKLYNKILDIIYHRYLAETDSRFESLTVEEIRFVTEIALKNYLNARITTYETVRILKGTSISHINHNANGEIWQDGDGKKYIKLYNKFYNREYLYNEESPTGYVIDSGNGDSMGNFAKHWYHSHGKTKMPKIYADLFYFLIDNNITHPESMQLFMYSPTSDATDNHYQNLLGITGYIEDAETKNQYVQMKNNFNKAKRKIKVTKVWLDEPNGEYNRPNSITVNLYANGELYDTITLSNENNWTYVFENLDMYNEGKRIEYTISEIEVDEYKTTIKGNMDNGFVIVNELNKKNAPTNNEIENPKTNDNIYISLLTSLLSLLSIIVLKTKIKNL